MVSAGPSVSAAAITSGSPAMIHGMTDRLKTYTAYSIIVPAYTGSSEIKVHRLQDPPARDNVDEGASTSESAAGLPCKAAGSV